MTLTKRQELALTRNIINGDLKLRLKTGAWATTLRNVSATRLTYVVRMPLSVQGALASMGDVCLLNLCWWLASALTHNNDVANYLVCVCV